MEVMTSKEFREYIEGNRSKFTGQKPARVVHVVSKVNRRTRQTEIPEYGQDLPYPGKEDALQRNVMKGIALIKGRPLAIHVPNGGGRSMVEAAIFKGMGVRKGVSDILVLRASGRYHGMCLELKARGGSVKVEQVEFMMEMQREGWYCCVAWNLLSALDAVEAYLNGKIPHE